MKTCVVEVCGDGKKHKEKYFCGFGDCNAVGCACDGGCIKGDPIENFLKEQDQFIFDELERVFAEPVSTYQNAFWTWICKRF